MTRIRTPDTLHDTLEHQAGNHVATSTVTRHNDPVPSPAQQVIVLQCPDVGVKHLLDSTGIGGLRSQGVVNGDNGNIQLLTPLVQVI